MTQRGQAQPKRKVIPLALFYKHVAPYGATGSNGTVQVEEMTFILVAAGRDASSVVSFFLVPFLLKSQKPTKIEPPLTQ
jgi:hypothetical protein